MKSLNILVIEDNEDLRFLIKAGLQQQGMDVATAGNAEYAISLLKGKLRPDLILLDIMLPTQSGIEALPTIKTLSNCPVVILSAKNALKDKVSALDIGADDYLTKPFEMDELVARINAHVRREQKNTPAGSAQKLLVQGWTLDLGQMQAFDETGRSANLTPNEFRILELMLSHPRRIFSREQLLEKTRMDPMGLTDRAVDTQVCRIRKKLGDKNSDKSMIQPVRGVGYCFSGAVKTLRDE